MECVAYVDLRLRLWSLTANMWTVPLSLDAHRNEESWLNDILSKHTKVYVDHASITRGTQEQGIMTE